MPPVDQFSDPAFGVLFRQVSQMPGLEAFVKTASVDTSEASTLPASAFAWPYERRFPIHTPEHAALSFAYAKVAGELPLFVHTNIDAALTVYKIPPTTFDTVKTAAEVDDQYLLPDLKLFPVKTAAETTRAQHSLLRDITKLDLENRALACANLVKVADAQKVELHPDVLKFAGFVVSSTKLTHKWLEARVQAAPTSLYKQAYQTLADGLKTLPIESKDRPGLLKLAAAIAELDQASGVDRHYDRKLPDALQTVFNTTKEASSTIDICGSMIPMSKLSALPASFWTDLGGSELSDEIAPGGVVDHAKLATVLETLPLDLKVILKSQMRA